MSGWAGWCFIHESEMFRVGVGTGTAGWFDFLQQTAVSDESLTAKSG